ncbi:longevity assurance proteins LAG1/LAC1 [Rickenella mellea]|uniref:Longevity assurance proteins LAG1/LAC1 n=1 Tax=Rickenella mellea TaxID=50990 RepID=A0A4R5XEV4_9AGAM|nr:longevity assurance proteins LAG1/LAC1 [Rickenella mellea]
MTSRKNAVSMQSSLNNLETDPSHHLTGPFVPQTPIHSNGSTPSTEPSHRRKLPGTPVDSEFYQSKGLWTDFKTLTWMRIPYSALKMLLIPVVLYFVWDILHIPFANPFAPLIFISHRVPDSDPSDPRYSKGWMDIPFVLYHVIVFSFIRQFAILKVLIPLGRRLGLKKAAKIDRFGEQGYAMLYHGGMGIWGLFIMSSLPTWWYQSEFYWIGYPHWDMKPLLKRYYLMQGAYWLQQLIVLALRLEKPRKDFKELVLHHIVTLYLIGWSYGISMTLIGNAVYASMDIPDAFLAFSKLCNYLQWEVTKTVSFVIFVFVWTYFRHWLNLVMLWSVIYENHLVPEASKIWKPFDGYWMPGWMKYQIFIPLFLLQLLNLFWYFLIWRILIRAVVGTPVDDERSDDEGDDGKED